MTSSCTPEILTRIADPTSFGNWKAVVSSTINSISPTAASGAIPPSTIEEATHAKASSDIFNTAACIQEQINELSTTTNSIQNGQSNMIKLQKQILTAEDDVAIARDRVGYIRHPEEHTSNYESWFPIDRPMKKGSVPYFMGATIFVAIFCILIIASLFGLDVNVSVSSTPSSYSSIFTKIYSQFTYLTGILMISLIAVVYYFMTRK